MSKQNEQNKKHSITFLNCYGDLTVTWEEKDAVKMESRIQKLLDEGLQFFIIKKRFLRPNKKVPIRSLRDLEKNEITAADKTIAKLFHDIDGEVCKDDTDSYDIVKSSNKPEEIVKSEVVCSKQPVAG
jgi:hypothetical protein